MNLWAAPGKQCVCIDADWDAECFGIAAPDRQPMINEVLTISEIITDADYLPRRVSIKGGVALCFVETGDWFYSISCFRPLITEEDDVEMFRSIVKQEEEKV